MNDTQKPCGIQFKEAPVYGGESTAFTGVCVACGIPIWAATLDDAQARFEHHRSIPAPPDEVLARPLTAADIDAYPAYFLNGRGYPLARQTVCEHGRALTEACPDC